MDPGLKLKRVREQLGLRYRQVEEASKQIAQKHRNSDYILGLSRLADIENKAVIPGLHRFYSLCAIYRLDVAEVLEWYGIDVASIFEDGLAVEPSSTHLIRIRDGSLEHAYKYFLRFQNTVCDGFGARIVSESSEACGHFFKVRLAPAVIARRAISMLNRS